MIDSTRIVKLGEDGATQGVHFASYEEATEVSQSLEGKDFDSLGCKICASPPVPSVSRFRRLLRRGQAFSMCCPLDKMASATSAELDTILESPDAVELQDLPADVYQDTGFILSVKLLTRVPVGTLDPTPVTTRLMH